MRTYQILAAIALAGTLMAGCGKNESIGEIAAKVQAEGIPKVIIVKEFSLKNPNSESMIPLAIYVDADGDNQTVEQVVKGIGLREEGVYEAKTNCVRPGYESMYNVLNGVIDPTTMSPEEVTQYDLEYKLLRQLNQF